jgi:hypothetical protein
MEIRAQRAYNIQDAGARHTHLSHMDGLNRQIARPVSPIVALIRCDQRAEYAKAWRYGTTWICSGSMQMRLCSSHIVSDF